MSELYGEPFATLQPAPSPRERLLGFGGLRSSQRVALRLDQVDAALTQLKASIDAGGLAPPTTAAIRAVYTGADGDGVPAAARRAIYDVHVAIFSTLTAASADLGRAYGLGRALSDTCHVPDDRGAFCELWEHFRLETVRGWLTDGATQFPAHSAKGVLDSLSRWEAWTANALGVLPDEDAWSPKHAPVKALKAELRRQGQLWRGLLSGEKNASDALTADTYVEAAGSLVRRSTEVVWPFVLRWSPLLLGTAAVVVGLVFAIAAVLPHGASQLVAIIGTVAAALGITWRTVGSSARGVATMLEGPLWQSELDLAVGRAITFLPAAPVVEPRADLLLGTPRYLRELEELGGSTGAAVTADALVAKLDHSLWSRLRRRSSKDEVVYWLAWATPAGYLKRVEDGYRITDEGRRLARLPQRRPDTVRAELAVGQAEA